MAGEGTIFTGCGKELGLSKVAASLSPGQSVDFAAGANPLTICNPEISWQSITFYYDPIRREAQYMGKPQSGISKDHQHYIFDEATSTWRTTGQALFPGLGHIWTTAFDYSTGDYFFRRWGENSFRWMKRSTETWTQTASLPDLAAGVSALNGAAYHPNLFGAEDGGIVCQSIERIMAWRRNTNRWTVLKSGSYGKNGHGAYIPSEDLAILGSGDFQGTEYALYSIGGGSGGAANGKVTNLGRPPVSVQGGGGSATAGKILLDPANASRLLLLEYNGSSRVWSSTDNGNSWSLESYKHPFASLDGASTNGFTAASVGAYGVIWAITSRVNPSTRTSRLWKPNN